MSGGAPRTDAPNNVSSASDPTCTPHTIQIERQDFVPVIAATRPFGKHRTQFIQLSGHTVSIKSRTREFSFQIFQQNILSFPDQSFYPTKNTTRRLPTTVRGALT